jgi:uncharacterized membrane protein HdeD (DUF308 family)
VDRDDTLFFLPLSLQKGVRIVRKDKLWWLVLIQGIVAIGLGLYIVSQPEQASANIGLLAAAYIFVSGITQTVTASTQTSKRTQSGLIRGIAGLVIGGGLLAAAWLGWVDLVTGYTLLAIGLVIYGGLGLWHQFFDRGESPFTWGPVILNALLALWGILVFVSRMMSFDLAMISAGILMVIGVLAGVWAFLSRPSGDEEDEAEIASDV